MPVDWEQLDRELDGIIETGAQRTDARLSSRISSLTRMTDKEVQELFPEPADIKKLTKLLNIVNASTSQNNKINSIVENAEEFAGVIITLLNKFV